MPIISPEQARALSALGKTARRTNTLIRSLEEWEALDVPRLASMPNVRRRVVAALQRAAEAAESGGRR